MKPAVRRATTILGIDPGPTRCAWALLDMRGPGRAVVLGCGLAATEGFDPVAVLALAGPGQAPVQLRAEQVLLAVERPAFRPVGGRADVGHSLALARDLVATAWVAGEIAGRARAHFWAVVAPTCGEVRRALLGRPSCTDRELAWALAHFVEVPRRTNAHTRDGMAVAIVGHRIASTGSVRLDATVSVEAQSKAAQCGGGWEER